MSEAPLLRDIDPDLYKIEKTGSELSGADGNVYGFRYFLTVGDKPKKGAEKNFQRRFRIENAVFPYAIKPGSVPKNVIPDADGRLPPGSFGVWERLSFCVNLVPGVHDEDMRALATMEDKLLQQLYARKSEMFVNGAHITHPSNVLMLWSTRFLSPSNGKTTKDGVPLPPRVWPDIVGWGNAIGDASVITWKETVRGVPTTKSAINKCTFLPRDPKYTPPPKTTRPTVFRVRLDGPDNVWADTCPWREDASYDNYDSPILLDESGNWRYRLIGPGDLTPGSTGTVHVDPTSIEVLPKSIGRGFNASIVEFTRAAPTTDEPFVYVAYDEGVGQEDRASAQQLQEFWTRKAQEARANAARKAADEAATAVDAISAAGVPRAAPQQQPPRAEPTDEELAALDEASFVTPPAPAPAPLRRSGPPPKPAKPRHADVVSAAAPPTRILASSPLTRTVSGPPARGYADEDAPLDVDEDEAAAAFAEEEAMAAAAAAEEEALAAAAERHATPFPGSIAGSKRRAEEGILRKSYAHVPPKVVARRT